MTKKKMKKKKKKKNEECASLRVKDVSYREQESFSKPDHVPPPLPLPPSDTPTMRGGATAVLLLLLLAVATTVHAQTCSTYDEATCYTNRATCHFKPLEAVCTDGAPLTCEENYRDSGATLGAECAVNTANNQWFTIPAAAPYDATLDAMTNSADCIAANGFWDPYSPMGTATGGHCYASLSEETSQFPLCLTWSNYPANVAAMACNDGRGCGLAGSNICVPLTDIAPVAPTNNQVSSNFTVSLLNARIIFNPYPQFEATLQLPQSQYFDPLHPRLHAFGFGEGPQAYDSNRLGANNACNNLFGPWPAYGIGEPKVDPPYADTATLYSTFQTNFGTDFSLVEPALEPALVDAMFDITGYTRFDSGILTSSTLSGNNVNLNIRQSMQQIITKCGGNFTTLSDDETRYDMSVWVMSRIGDNVAKVKFDMSPIVYTWGSSNLGATAANTYTLRLGDQFANGVTPSSKHRAFSVFLTYRTQSASNVIGLRSLDDVSMFLTGGNGAQPVGAPTNCFGTHPVQVLPPTHAPKFCSGSSGPYCWTTRVDFETRDLVPNSSGDSLNLCSYQLEADRAAEMGGSGGTPAYPSNLDYDQSFYQFPKQWLWASGPTGSNTVAGTDPTGATGDRVQITLTTKVFPLIGDVQGRIPDPKCGILPRFDSPLEDVVTPTTNMSGFLVDMRNAALANNYLLCVACFFETPDLRSAYELFIKDGSVFNGLDASGEIQRDDLDFPLTERFFSELLPYIPYTTRSHPGARITASTLELGVDGFCVAPAVLRDKLEAPGAAMQLQQYARMPPVGDLRMDQSNPTPGRRLLQFEDDEANNTASNTTTVTTPDLVVMNNTVTISILFPESALAVVEVVHYRNAAGNVSAGVFIGVVVSIVALGLVGIWLTSVYMDRPLVGKVGDKTPLVSSLVSGKAMHRSNSVPRSRSHSRAE